MGRRKAEEPVSERIYQQLRQSIVSLDLPPGLGLVESHLTEQFGVSRTPIREALGRLAHDGLVSIERGGVYVSRVTPKDFQDIYEVREALEGMAAAMAARRLTDDQLEELEKAQADVMAALEAADHPRVFEADAAFHRKIVHISGNLRIDEVLERYTLVVARVRFLGLWIPGRTEAVVPEHKEILDALRRRDPVAAEEAARIHVARVRDSVGQFITHYSDAGLAAILSPSQQIFAVRPKDHTSKQGGSSVEDH